MDLANDFKLDDRNRNMGFDYLRSIAEHAAYHKDCKITITNDKEYDYKIVVYLNEKCFVKIEKIDIILTCGSIISLDDKYIASKHMYTLRSLWFAYTSGFKNLILHYFNSRCINDYEKEIYHYVKNNCRSIYDYVTIESIHDTLHEMLDCKEKSYEDIDFKKNVFKPDFLLSDTRYIYYCFYYFKVDDFIKALEDKHVLLKKNLKKNTTKTIGFYV